MSLPKFLNSSDIPTIEQAIASIVVSIAMEETALSHIMEAESEKINYVLEATKDGGDIDKLLEVNESVADVMESIVKLQAILKEKLEVAINYAPPTPPDPPAPDPSPPCFFPKLRIEPGSVLYEGNTIYVEKPCNPCPCVGKANNADVCCVSVMRENCETRILLPLNKTVNITLELAAENRSSKPVIFQAEIRTDGKISHTEVLEQQGQRIAISHTLRNEPPVGGGRSSLTLRLMSPERLYRLNGNITFKTNYKKSIGN